jgi:hypothetical protein
MSIKSGPFTSAAPGLKCRRAPSAHRLMLHTAEIYLQSSSAPWEGGWVSCRPLALRVCVCVSFEAPRETCLECRDRLLQVALGATTVHRAAIYLSPGLGVAPLPRGGREPQQLITMTNNAYKLRPTMRPPGTNF